MNADYLPLFTFFLLLQAECDAPLADMLPAPSVCERYSHFCELTSLELTSNLDGCADDEKRTASVDAQCYQELRDTFRGGKNSIRLV